MLKRKKLICFALALALLFSTISTKPLLPSISAKAESTQVTLIPNNAVWKYNDKDVNLYSSQFYLNSYNDSGWSTGVQPLGYPTTDTNPTFGALSSGTLVASRATPNAIITYYFRRDFTVASLQGLLSLTATVGHDDGFVMYINGTEVSRRFINAGTVTHATTANFVNEPSGVDGTVVLDLTSAIPLLTTGTNKIAVSVHNSSASSTDIYFAMNLIAGYDGTQYDANKVPKQVNSHVGLTPSTQINITYTTIAADTTKIVYRKSGDTVDSTAYGTNSQGQASKYYHSIPLTGLTPGTQYLYTVGNGPNSYSGKFKTAPAGGSKASFKFAYITDPQVSNSTNSKALGATMAQVAAGNYDFVYTAGDHADTNTNEAQWELLFNNGGAYPTGGQDMYGNNTIAVAQGNHDTSTFQGHFKPPAAAGNVVYSYDWGPATFIIINLESARLDANARTQQTNYITTVANDAKQRGQWVVVGYHKSLYTGASHIVDADVIEARKYWAPVLANLDVDLVLQGHDHVYARGFVTGTGQRANPTVGSDGKVTDPSNAPLFMVGGHAGGLKWFSKINYSVGTGDPLLPSYAFLDANSNDTGGDIKQEQTYNEIEVSDTEFTVKTYMFKYNTTTDTITTPKYLYDTVTVKRQGTPPSNWFAGDGFNSYATGSTPTGWSINNSGGTVTVQDVPSATEKSMRLQKTDANANYAAATKKFTAQTSGIIRYDTWVMSTETGSSKFLMLRDYAGSKIVFKVTLDNGNIKVNDSTTIGTFTANQWYHVVADLNINTKTMNMYINDQLKGNYSFYNTTATDIGEFLFSIHPGFLGTFYVNNVMMLN